MSEEQVPIDDSPAVGDTPEVESRTLVVFCLGCKRRSVISDAKEEDNKGGRKIIKGECGYDDCRKPVTRFLEKIQ
jgi:hypothetical protein